MGPIETLFCIGQKKGTQLGQRGPDETGALVDDGSFPD